MLDLAQLQQELHPLEQRCASAELVARGRALLAAVPAGSPQEAYLHYVIGKGLVGLGQVAEALAPLQRALALQPAHGHAHYLLGYGLAQQRQWPAALQAQQRACGLSPHLADAWYEQGRAAAELARHGLAVAALERALQLRPGWDGAQALLQACRVRLALELGQRQVVPALISAALADADAAPPPWLLLEWLQLAGALLLAGQPPQAVPLLQALSTATPCPQACGQPLPRRPALLLLLLVALLHPGDPAEAEHWRVSLRETLWQPGTTSEQALWPELLEPAAWLLLARPVPEPELAAGSLQLVRQALELLDPGRGVAPSPVHRALAERYGPLPGAPVAPPLPLLAADPLRCLQQLDQVRQQPASPSQRRALDRQLWAVSTLMLDRPQRLVQQPGAEAEALALRQQCLDALLAAEPELLSPAEQPPLPAAQPAGPRRRWLLLASADLPQCWLYRVEQKRQQLEALGCSVRVVEREQLDSWRWSADLLWADAVLVCRLAATHPVLRAIAAARSHGLPVLADIDDLLFDPEHCPPAFATYGGSLRPAVHRRFGLDVPLYAAVIAQCDGLIVSTLTLAQRWRALQPRWQRPMWVLPNLAPPELLARVRPPRRGRAAQPLRITFASGTTAHKQAWQEELAPALAQLLAANPRLELDLLGPVPLPPELLPYSARIRCFPYAPYAPYLEQLAQAQIGVVVLEPGTYTDAKSAIRWMEFSLLGLASVLSPTATYTESLEPGRHALFARGVQAWVAAVQQLIDDPVRRRALASQAQQRALELFGPDRAAEVWRPLIGAAPQLPPASQVPARRRRLLVLNVFFAPQSMGGATRVAQDQVRELIQRAGDRYEITVLCADHQPWQLDEAEQPDPAVERPLAHTVHQWHGARVVRLALPPQPWRQHHDASVAAFCRRWFAEEGFDLIHAHCLQQLTAAPLQVAAACGIPYVITLHDGWWLSPRLFLTTASGRPIDPADPLGHYDDPALQPPERLEEDRRRRLQLEQVLAGAAARLAVSAPFAAVVRQGGIADVEVLDNDWQPMAAAPRPPRCPEQPLRLLYLGGLALHKGYAVLKAALLRHQLPAAVLTVVDGSLRPGEAYSLAWNGTPVEFVAPVPMAEMAAFYAQHEVLIAPSIWPESYGLVTREALSAGLWVVASAIGALADPIAHGVNGHRLPAGDADALGLLLQQLCAAPPTPKPLLQFAGDRRRAVDQLLPLYERVLTAAPARRRPPPGSG